MNIEEKVKMNLLIRGFDNKTQLNNRGLIGATIDETILEVVKNLRIADVSYCAASPEDIADNYYTAECSKCGWWGSSKFLDGGGAIADTGDYFDCTCPVCGNADIDERHCS